MNLFHKAARWGTGQITWLKEQRINGLHALLAVTSAFLFALLIGTQVGPRSRFHGSSSLQPLEMCDDVRHPVFTGKERRNLPNCSNTFIRYRPSPWEQFWAREIQRLESDSPLWEDGCGQVRADKVLVAQMSGDLSVFNHSYCQPTGINYALSLDVFSAMEVSERCELPGGSATMRHNHTIEPLVSFLRDPRAVCALEEGPGAEFDRLAHDTVYSREFLLIATPPCDGVARLGRRILFAVGARPSGPAEVSHAGSGGNRWLAETYAKRGLPFDAVYVWEPAEVSQTEFWGTIPDNLRQLTHFFNVPLDTAPESALNPLRVILSVATPDDFVVVKLDANEPDKEMKLVELILATKELVDIIDELFWQHVTTGSPMQYHGWGDAGGRTRSTLSDTYRLLGQLRRKGIRAHSWA